MTFPLIRLPEVSGEVSLGLTSSMPRSAKFWMMLFLINALFTEKKLPLASSVSIARRESVLIPPTTTALVWDKPGLLPSTTKPSMVTLSAMMCSVSLGASFGSFVAAVMTLSTDGSAFGPLGPAVKAANRVLAFWPA